MKARYLFLTFAFAVASRSYSQVHVGNGGDDMRLGYKLAAASMAKKVADLLPCSFSPDTPANVKDWLLANKADFSDDIKQSAQTHQWTEENRSTCAYTYRERNAVTLYSFPRCLETGNTRTKAEKVVVHESVHHFGFDDEVFPDHVAQAVFNASYRVSCPNTRPDPARVILKSGRDHSCAIYDAKVFCWGEASGLEGMAPDSFTNPRDLAVTSSGTCVVDEDRVRCFHDGMSTPAWIVQVPTHSRVEGIFGGYSSMCMVERSGTKCWGDSSTTAYMNLAVEPKEFTSTAFEGYVLDRDGVKHSVRSGRGLYLINEYQNPRTIAGAQTNFCVLEDRGVICYQPSNPPIEHLEYPTQIAVGEQHGCAIDGSNVRCWGPNHYGQAPSVMQFSNPYAISAGDRFTCVADDDGVYCFGAPAFTEVPDALTR